MRETDFESYLDMDTNIQSKVKAVNSRMSKARMIERHFIQSLDSTVSDDDRMYETLLRIKKEMNDTNGSISNALRKYFHFVNGKSFPQLSQYRQLSRKGWKN